MEASSDYTCFLKHHLRKGVAKENDKRRKSKFRE